MSALRTRVLLREYIKTVLNEDEAGAIAGDLMGGAVEGMPYGMHFGSGKDLYNIFIRPFTDVAHVAAGKTKEMSARTQTLLKTGFEALATTLVPLLSSDYEKIFSSEKQKLDKIKGEYAEVYQRTWDAFKDHDVLCAAFMYSPIAFMTTAFFAKAPREGMKLMSVLSGGSLDGVLDKIRAKFSTGAKGKSPSDVFGGETKSTGGGVWSEGSLHEDNEAKDGNPKEKLANILANKKLVFKVAENPLVQKMEREGKALVHGTLKQVYAKAKGVLSAKSLQDLERITGKKLSSDKLAGVPQQERQAAEQQLLETTKKAMKEFYVRNLEAQVKSAIEAGVPEAHPYVRDYQNVISKIKAL